MTAHAIARDARTPFAITIYEASGRLGGKVLTRWFERLPARYEAGAAEFYDYSVVGPDPLRELVHDCGLSVVPMAGSGMLVGGRVIANVDDVRDVLGQEAAAALARFDRLAHDAVGPRDFYRGELEAMPRDSRRFSALLAEIGHPTARRHVEQLIHSDLATEPDRTTVAYGLDNYLMNDPAYMSLYAIDGGNEQLVTALAARIRATRRLRHTVTRIARSADGRLRVTGTHAAGMHDDVFDAVVLALPVDHLKGVEFVGPRLAAAMARHIAHHDHPAHYLRITMLFDSPFWRPRMSDSFVMLDSFGGCCLYDESSRVPEAAHGSLGWLLGGTAAEEMSRLDDEELLTAALDSLPPSIGPARRHSLEGHVHRWKGAVSAMPGGLVPRRLDDRHRPEPVEHPGLFVVGDYLFDSTLNGVLDSAEYVAGWMNDLFDSTHGVAR